ILAVAAFPLFSFIQKKTKLSYTLTAILLTVFSLVLIILPCYLLMSSLINEFHAISSEFKSDKLGALPPALANLPIVGNTLSETWTMASKNTPMLFSKYETQLHSVGTWFLAFAMGLGSGIVHLLLSIILAGIFLVYSKSGSAMAHKLFVRLAGENGDKFSHVAERTIQNVTKGIIGVSAIDAILASIGFFIAGVPLAGVWTLVCFILCVVQIGVLPVAVPVVIYMFYTASTLTGILLGVWMVVIYVSDHLMKPVLLGKGAPVPMPVIFIGVIGGFIAAGFVGMFLGAVVFSIAYNLFLVWLDNSVDGVASKAELQE
ncbi:MAG: AI-2E family transporter, partial [Cytophagales bacterium]|nr:AI-2E family transporter [Cytophaga sp.]